MRQVLETSKAPSAIGPYSQGILTKCGSMVFLSGQIALDPATGDLIEGDARAQTNQVLDNLKAVLQAAGCTFENVVKTTIYLKDMIDFSAVNEVYATRFLSAPPARACVEVSRLPKDVAVEIDAIAVHA